MIVTGWCEEVVLLPCFCETTVEGDCHQTIHEYLVNSNGFYTDTFSLNSISASKPLARLKPTNKRYVEKPLTSKHPSAIFHTVTKHLSHFM